MDRDIVFWRIMIGCSKFDLCSGKVEKGKSAKKNPGKRNTLIIGSQETQHNHCEKQ